MYTEDGHTIVSEKYLKKINILKVTTKRINNMRARVSVFTQIVLVLRVHSPKRVCAGSSCGVLFACFSTCV